MRDAVDNDRIGAWFVHARTAQLDELGDDVFVATVHFIDESGRKRPFPPDNQANL